MALSSGQVVSKPAVCQECQLLSLFRSCRFVLIHAMMLKARDLLARHKRALKLQSWRYPRLSYLQRLFLISAVAVLSVVARADEYVFRSVAFL